MSTASKFFKSSMASDVPLRIAQQKVFGLYGANSAPHGKMRDPQKDGKPSDSPKRFIVGKTVIGGGEVVG